MIQLNLRNHMAAGSLSLSGAFIKAAAEKMLTDFCPAVLQSPQAVDVDAFITNYLGFKLRYELLTHNLSLLGVTNYAEGELKIFDPVTKGVRTEVIDVNTVIIDTRLTDKENRARYVYTAGHEAGHIIFDNPAVRRMREDSRQLAMECSDEFFEAAYHTANAPNDSNRWIEHYCDYFSSCLILPDKTVKTAGIELLRKNGIASDYIYPHSAAEQRFCIDTLASGISKIFETSKEAAMYKLFDLKVVRGGRDFFAERKSKYRNYS